MSQAAPYNASTQRSMRDIVTPEGIALKAKLADIGSRAGAFVLDLIFITIALIALTVLCISLAVSMGEWGGIIWLLGFFFLRSFYFMYFEMGPKGATPGKRICKIRVASRKSARLSGTAIFARNAMREIEFFLPFVFMVSGAQPGVDGWISFLGLIWSLVFLFFPVFNKDRLRAGDLIAGTWVVEAPRPILGQDLADETQDDNTVGFGFTSEELSAYGVHELHVLEDVIRTADPLVLSDVASRIRRKIGRPESISNDDLEFLKAYYADLRQSLEVGLLFGVRKRDKYDTR